MDKLNKLSWPAVILIAVIIFGGLFLVSQTTNQKLTERQQELKSQEDKKINDTKTEQTKKEYVAKRKGECYDISEKERGKLANVSSFNYDEDKDICTVSYRFLTESDRLQICGRYEAVSKKILEMVKAGQDYKTYEELNVGDLNLSQALFDCGQGLYTKEF